MDDAQQRPDEKSDFLGAVWDWYGVDELPADVTIKLVVLTRRSESDSVPRHELRIFAGHPSTGSAPIYTIPVPGLASDQRNGVMVAHLQARLTQVGPMPIYAQIDDGPVVGTEFEVRLNG